MVGGVVGLACEVGKVGGWPGLVGVVWVGVLSRGCSRLLRWLRASGFWGRWGRVCICTSDCICIYGCAHIHTCY